MAIKIDRCVCHDTSFDDLKSLAQTKELDEFMELFEDSEADFGRGCGMCRVYVDEMLKSGETNFQRLILRDDPLLAGTQGKLTRRGLKMSLDDSET